MDEYLKNGSKASRLVSRENQLKNRLLPISEAAKFSFYSAEYLSLRARQGKLKARKIDGAWFTSRRWVYDYQKTCSQIPTAQAQSGAVDEKQIGEKLEEQIKKLENKFEEITKKILFPASLIKKDKSSENIVRAEKSREVSLIDLLNGTVLAVSCFFEKIEKMAVRGAEEFSAWRTKLAAEARDNEKYFWQGGAGRFLKYALPSVFLAVSGIWSWQNPGAFAEIGRYFQQSAKEKISDVAKSVFAAPQKISWDFAESPKNLKNDLASSFEILGQGFEEFKLSSGGAAADLIQKIRRSSFDAGRTGEETFLAAGKGLKDLAENTSQAPFEAKNQVFLTQKTAREGARTAASVFSEKSFVLADAVENLPRNLAAFYNLAAQKNDSLKGIMRRSIQTTGQKIYSFDFKETIQKTFSYSFDRLYSISGYCGRR